MPDPLSAEDLTPAGPPPGYPDELVERSFLEDGTAVVFRPVRPDDDAAFERLFDRLSPHTRYLRFFTPVVRIDRTVLRRLVTVDYVDRLALVAEVAGEVVGVARYDRLPPAGDGPAEEAEVAVVVEDAWQGLGIATRLLWRLSSAAQSRGVRTFVAGVLGENRRMMGVLGVLADDLETTLEEGEYRVRIVLSRVREHR